ncbi:MAG: hypothetical protein K0U66_10075, partial [Gammaproteobacteria bacterium]|nr:hypothetical protein [Gammaproteobacteria bacterium]
MGRLPDTTNWYSVHAAFQHQPPDTALSDVAALACKTCPIRITHDASYHIYIDGSYLPHDVEASAWALIIVAEDSQGTSFGGALYHNAQCS